MEFFFKSGENPKQNTALYFTVMYNTVLYLDQGLVNEQYVAHGQLYCTVLYSFTVLYLAVWWQLPDVMYCITVPL